jgi:hypothetical protein
MAICSKNTAFCSKFMCLQAIKTLIPYPNLYFVGELIVIPADADFKIIYAGNKHISKINKRETKIKPIK